MGQYYYVVNIDKRQYLHPHKCGDGLKLLEFGISSCGTMACLAILLADGNGRGGGDLHGPPCKACNGTGFELRKDGSPRRRNDVPVFCKVCGGARNMPPPEIVGSWAGDRIVIAGDYADNGEFLPEELPDEVRSETNLMAYADANFEDISIEAMRALAGDIWIREELSKNKSFFGGDENRKAILGT